MAALQRMAPSNLTHVSASDKCRSLSKNRTDMADEQKPPESAPPPPSGSEAAPPQKPAPPPKAAAPAAPAAGGHAAPPKPPATMAATPWQSDLSREVKERFGERIVETSAYLGQNF